MMSKLSDTLPEGLSGDALRHTIMAAARRLFVERGYQATRITDIATAADVSPNSIYTRFASKRELHDATMGHAPLDPPESRATARGRRTRSRLLEAGRRSFETHGFHACRIADVCADAGVATATFYTYFEAKEPFFREVVVAAARELFDAVTAPLAPETSPRACVQAGVERYFSAYLAHGRLFTALDHAAADAEALDDLRRATRAPLLQRASERLADWQQRGWADADIDPLSAADAVLAMVERSAALAHNGGRDQADPAAVSTLIVRGLGITDDPTS